MSLELWNWLLGDCYKGFIQQSFICLCNWNSDQGAICRFMAKTNIAIIFNIPQSLVYQSQSQLGWWRTSTRSYHGKWWDKFIACWLGQVGLSWPNLAEILPVQEKNVQHQHRALNSLLSAASIFLRHFLYRSLFCFETYLNWMVARPFRFNHD